MIPKGLRRKNALREPIRVLSLGEDDVLLLSTSQTLTSGDAAYVKSRIADAFGLIDSRRIVIFGGGAWKVDVVKASAFS